MSSSRSLVTAGVAGWDADQRDAVTPPAVVRGWLYDPAEHWWAVLVGAPPHHG